MTKGGEHSEESFGAKGGVERGPIHLDHIDCFEMELCFECGELHGDWRWSDAASAELRAEGPHGCYQACACEAQWCRAGSPRAALARLRLQPSRRAVSLLRGPARGRIAIHDVTGRRVRSLAMRDAGALWDGRNESRKPVPAGLYLARVGSAATARLLRVE